MPSFIEIDWQVSEDETAYVVPEQAVPGSAEGGLETNQQKNCNQSLFLCFPLSVSSMTYGTVNVVDVGGLDRVHPVCLHVEVTATKAEDSKAVEATGIFSCVDSNDK